jgi:uncharacterized membrane protein YgdD (TMEM256/DUF423 family)
MHRKIYFAAAIFGVLAVAIGAFGSHLLKSRLSDANFAVFQTGVQYHFYHVFALLITGLFYRNYKHNFFNYAATCFGVGILFFSFSLYIMKLTTLTSDGEEKWLGYLTPLGGVLFIIGWVFIAIYFIKEREKPSKKSSSSNQ